MGCCLANDGFLTEGKRILIDDPGWFDAVAVIGVDEHANRDGTGPTRLLDIVEGRSKADVQDLACCPPSDLA